MTIADISAVPSWDIPGKPVDNPTANNNPDYFTAAAWLTLWGSAAEGNLLR